MKQSKFYQIKNITEREYTLVDCDGSVITRPIQDVDKSASAFTIQDAKDGDVLACESGWTCIFKKLNHNSLGGLLFDSYCFIDRTGWFCDRAKGHILDERINGKIYPATKEQRDLLFTKMKEAGYEWDADKKELKKIEQNLWSEEDDRMYNRIVSFIPQHLTAESYTACISWLKSLRERVQPQSHWKPSKEHIKALEDSIEFLGCTKKVRDNLKSLYEQLKKLREA